MDLIYAVIIYVLLVSIVTFFAFGMDKKKARKSKWRISEGALMVLTLIGGAPGAMAGMLHFRHKTKMPLFVIGVPVIFAIWVAALTYLLLRYK